MRFAKKILFVSALFVFYYAAWLPCAQASAAGDIENHWAQRDIEAAINLGIAVGYPDESFGPDQMVSRAEFVKMLMTAGWVNLAPNNKQPTFEDVGSGHWAFPYVEAAAVAGIVAAEERPAPHFKPEGIVTRAEVAVLAGRLLAAEGLPGMPAAEDTGPDNWAAVVKKEGIMYGYPDGSLGEDSGLTRAEACAVALRLKKKLLAAQADRERHWLTTAQSQDGYIALSADRPDIIPYFGNLTEMAQLGQAEHLGGVKKYLEWSLSNLNFPDRWGLNGTIYDHRLEDGVARSVYAYDSADSYAATLLSLAAGYYSASGDINFIREHYRDLSAVAEIISTLQDTDGLTWAKPDRQFKYLMDNCECYQGLQDWSYLLARLGFKEQSGLYESRAGLIKKGILEQFWDEGTASFAWAVGSDGGKCLSSPGEAYPGFFAQIYPVTCGVISPDSEKALLAYQKLNGELPRWAELEVGDPLPWAILGYAAVMMDDLARADRFLANCRSTYILEDHRYPWSTFEDAFYIRACDALQENI